MIQKLFITFLILLVLSPIASAQNDLNSNISSMSFLNNYLMSGNSRFRNYKKLNGIGEINKGVLNVNAFELKFLKIKDLYYKGRVLTPEISIVPFTKNGTLTSIIGKGGYVFKSIAGEDGVVLRLGNTFASISVLEAKQKLVIAEKQKKIADMAYHYVEKMTNAQKNLAKKKIITSFALDNAKMSLLTGLLEYEENTQNIEDTVIRYKSPEMKSSESGLVVDVMAVNGDVVNIGQPALKIMKMDYIKIKIKYNTELIDLVQKRPLVYIYPNGISKPVRAELEINPNVPYSLYAFIQNEVIDSSRLTNTQKKLKKVYQVLTIKNIVNKSIETFYKSENLPDKSPLLFIPVDTIKKDKKGTYILLLKSINNTILINRNKNLFKVEKKYIELDDVFSNIYYGYDINRVKRVQRIKNSKDFSGGEMIVSQADYGIKNGEKVILVNAVWKFYPGQTVRVKIPSLSRDGIYVPRNTVLHEDFNKNYVYVVENGIAKLTKVSVLAEYEKYLLIAGEGINNGGRVVDLNINSYSSKSQSILTKIYDGRKVKVIETLEAPLVIGEKHVNEFIYNNQISESGANSSSRNSGSNSDSISSNQLKKIQSKLNF